MKKIGFLVGRNFWTSLYGIRNFISTIANICANKYLVDYVMYKADRDGIQWSICDTINRPTCQKDSSMAMEYDTDNRRKPLNYDDFIRFQKKNDIRINALSEYFVSSNTPEFYFREIGDDLSIENYDLLVITAPYIIEFPMKLPAKKVIGIVHDLIPNILAAGTDVTDFHWAHMHQRGNEYFIRSCDGIYANSIKTAAEYNTYYGIDKVTFLPSFFPYSFRDGKYTGEKKENAVVLAAPFDLRKGIERIPALINGAADLIDTLYIFGMPRCTPERYDAFFKKMRVKRIVYYPYINNEDLISLYRKCKLLLFPSLDEGLGIPIIEAQICGCRVVTTDKKPMNELAGPGSCLLEEESDEQKNIDMIRSMLCDDDFDYGKMCDSARERFSLEGVLKVFDGLMNETP